MTENSPGYSKRVGLYEGTLATGATYVVPTFAVGGYGRIVGTLNCNKAVTVQVLQGPSETYPGDASESWTSTGDANFGAGDLYSHLIRVPEGVAQIRISNASGATATYRLSVGLTRAH